MFIHLFEIGLDFTEKLNRVKCEIQYLMRKKMRLIYYSMIFKIINNENIK